MEIFHDYAYYYNAFYQDKDYKKEVMQVDKLLKTYGNGIKTILDFGCGTGKHDKELESIGYYCMGIDISPLMIDIARESERDCIGAEKFWVADIRKFVSEKKYDAVISLFHVMSYQTKNDDILAAFIAARNALNKGGLFLFDAWYGPGVLNDRPSIRVKEAEDEKNRLIRIARPVMYAKTNIVDVAYEVLIIDKETNVVKCMKEIHNMRYIFTPEVEKLLAEAGFELITNIDCESLKEADYHSWTSYFIAKAI